MAAMDLSSYTGLCAAVGKFLARGDLADQIPGFIQLAEAEIRRRVRRKTVRATVILTADSFPVPSNCSEMRSIRLVTSEKYKDKPLMQQTAIQLDERRAAASGVAGRPQFWAVVGNSILFERTPSIATQAELRFYEKLVPLSSSVASNSVLEENPDIYLYGALKQSAPYLQHDERIPVWSGFFNDGVTQLDTVRQNEENAGAPQSARLPAFFG